MREKRALKAPTLAAQALGWIDEGTRAVIPPIHPATTYLSDPRRPGRHGRIYTRDDNPTYDQAEALLAALEGGEAALLFSSGLAAIATVFQALEPGDHVVAPEVIYHGVRSWLKEIAAPWGLEPAFVPNGDLVALERAVEKGRTRLIWVETPANPTWAITDIAGAAEIARRTGARLAVDNTAATPVLTRPLELGADLVVHSATKYLNGHSDVLAGAVVSARSDELMERIRRIRKLGGAVPGPFESWLLLRGMRTLFLRVEASSRSAQALAEHLHDHPRVAEVLYPGLPDHPHHGVAARQMDGGFGGMLSIRVAGGEAAALEVWANVKVFKRATSLGGVESLIEHRASIEGPDSPIPRDLLRLSVGIEDADDLIADLDEALAIV
ncbi:MAG: trans-sulfuration enzyme family protein [Alphaproteobacteria bacterium]